MANQPRIFSGMQPTGELHIGNYFGALRQWVALSKAGTHQAIFCIVDAHAVTIDYDPKEMPKRIFETALTYLAAGIDPDSALVFVQSDVHEQAELAWYLSTVTAMGDLYRMTQFKEKSEEHKQNVNAGLLTYPVLMAADILAYRAALVPVGNDQVQHLELSREICRKFNARYGETFPEPQPHLSHTPRIMGLDGKTKMSKSRGNAVSLFESPASIEKKIKSAFTDPDKLRKGDPGNPSICNIYTIHGAVSPSEKLTEIDQSCRAGTLGCGDCKKWLVEQLDGELTPLRRKADELRREPGRVLQVLQTGAEAARSIARDTLVDVRRAMGLGCPTSLRG
jgi:tryptophanyl-tRNA synthetase